jgi:hypothetical protein
MVSALTMDFWLYWRVYSLSQAQHWFNKQQATGTWSDTFAEHGFQNRTYSGNPEQMDVFCRTSGSSPSVLLDSYRIFPLYEWAHIGFTYDSAAGGNNFIVYLNGDVVATAAGTGTLAYGSGPWFVGAIPGGSNANEEMAAAIADARISNIARPLSYFQNIYSQGMLKLSTSITKRYYKLWAKYNNCSTTVEWIDTAVNLTNVPANPCGGGFVNVGPVVLDTWVQ